MANLTFDDIATHAIVEGFSGGLEMFMEDLNTTLVNDTLIQESGGVDNLIEEAIKPSFEEIQSKLASVVAG